MQFRKCRKFLRHGLRLYFPPKEDVLSVFIALKKTIASAGFQSDNLEANGKHTYHYTTEATNRMMTTYERWPTSSQGL
jgi:hypothetical protein